MRLLRGEAEHQAGETGGGEQRDAHVRTTVELHQDERGA